MSADDVRDLRVSGGRTTTVDSILIQLSSRQVRSARDDLDVVVARCAAARELAPALDVATPAGPQAAAHLAMLGHLSQATLVTLDAAARSVRDTLEAAQGQLATARDQLTDLARATDHAAGIYDDVDASVWSRFRRGAGNAIDGMPVATVLGVEIPFSAVRGVGRSAYGAVGGEGWQWKYVTGATAGEQEALTGDLARVFTGAALLGGVVGGVPPRPRDGDVPAAADSIGRVLGVSRATFEDLPEVNEIEDPAVVLSEPRTMHEALENIDVLYDSHSDALPIGSVGVQHIVADDGSSRWLVTVPGTQLGEGSAFGITQDVQMMSSDPAVREASDTVQVVLESMRQAGVGADDDVMIVGHSLGGMAATVVAGGATGYQVRQIVTAGSPVAHYAVPEGVRATHIEVDGEIISALDGAPNPATPNRVTVSGGIDPGAMGSDAVTHTTRYQLDVLDAATREGSPALGANLAAAEEFLDGEVVETRIFEGHLVARPPEPAAPLPPVVPVPPVLPALPGLPGLPGAPVCPTPQLGPGA